MLYFPWRCGRVMNLNELMGDLPSNITIPFYYITQKNQATYTLKLKVRVITRKMLVLGKKLLKDGRIMG